MWISKSKTITGKLICSKKDAIIINIIFTNVSSRVEFLVKQIKGILDIQMKITMCEVVLLNIKMFKKDLGYQLNIKAFLICTEFLVMNIRKTMEYQ